MIAANGREVPTAGLSDGSAIIEPESRAGRIIAHSLLGKARLAAIPDGLVDDLLGELKLAYAGTGKSNELLIGVGRSMIARLAGFTEPELPDRRVQTIITQVACGYKWDRQVAVPYRR